VARCAWRRRALQLAAGAAIVALLGGYFYARNVVLGAGPLAARCYSRASGLTVERPWRLPREDSVLDGGAGGASAVVEAFLGTALSTRRLEMGVGPQVAVLALAMIAVPLGLGRDRRREGLVAAALLWLPLALWLALPPAVTGWVYANVRYLDASIATAVAAAVALAERRGLPRPACELLAVAFMLQGLLQLAPAMPFAARVALAAADLAAVVLVAAPRLRAVLSRHALAVGGVLLAAGLLAAAPLAAFRRADRSRAFRRELSVHATTAPVLAGAWQFLDTHAGAGTVAILGTPFPYAAMGPRLERRAVYVSRGVMDAAHSAGYPRCDPRSVPADAAAWRRNLARHDARWLYVVRNRPRDLFPVEVDWALADPVRFRLRHSDAYSRVFEIGPGNS
jgi:hypothetical protein